MLPIPAEPIVDQLAGRDVAIILSIAFVFFAIFLIVLVIIIYRMQTSDNRKTGAIEKMASSIEKKTENDAVQTDAIKDLVLASRTRAEVADKAYQEIFKVGEEVRKLTNSDSDYSIITVTSELRRAAIELLDVARKIETSAIAIEESTRSLKTLPQE